MNQAWYSDFKKSRWYRKAVWAAVALVVYTLVGFLILPAIIKSQLLKRLPELTKRQVAIDTIRLNPYALSFTMRGFSLTETNGETFASLGELYVNFELSSVFRGAFTFGEVSVKEPFGQVTRMQDGTFNFANLIPPTPTNAPPLTPKVLPAVLVQLLSIEGGSIAWTDNLQLPPFKTKLSPIRLELTQLTTRPDKNSPYSFTASDDAGMTLSWSGKVSVQPIASEGRLKIEGVSLPKYAAYGDPFFKGRISGGKVGVEGQYHVEIGDKGLQGGLTNGAVQLRNLTVRGTNDTETLVSLPSADVTGISADLATLTARVGLVSTEGMSLLARREKDGSINLLNLLKPQPPSTNAPLAVKLAVDQVTVTNYTVQFEDLTLPKPGKVKIDQFAVSVKGFNTATNAPIETRVSMRLNEAGTVGVDGVVHAFPPDADVNVAVAGLDIRPFQPFAVPFVNIALRGGLVGVQGKAKVALPAGGTPSLQFTGDVSVDQFDTADGLALQDFVKWQSLAVKGIDLKSSPQDVAVEEINLKGLQTSLIVGADKAINLLTVLKMKQGGETNEAAATPVESKAPAPVPTTTVVAANPLPVRLKMLTLEGASLRYSDQSLQPNCNFAVQHFDVKVSGISTIGEQAADVSVSGRIDDLSPFSVTGKIRPVLENLLVDLVISNRNMDLTAFTPYMEKFGGYPIAKGKVSVALKYDIKGKALTAGHVIVVDQFTLGAKNSSPDAINLPLKLGVALLKDRHGKIDLDLPVSGRLDDPKFRVLPVVMKVLVNLVAKAVTSPFALLGKLVGGGEEMSFAAFEPGVGELSPAEQEKMGKLAKALEERPGLNLEIAGSADVASDRSALARLQFEEGLKTSKLKEIAATGATPPAAADLKLEPADRVRLITAAYVSAFGPLPVVVTNGVTNAVAIVAKAATNVTTNAAKATVKKASSRSASMKSGNQVMADLQKTTEKTVSNTNGVATAVKTASTNEVKVAESASAIAAVPAQAATISLEEMESRLLSKVEMPDSELVALMQRRAKSVQAHLEKVGQVAPERLFIIAPKPIDPAFKGETKVNLLLN